MTPYQFSQLQVTEQEESIYDEGVFLASRDEGELMYDLYQIDTFYVEFSYNINIKSQHTRLRWFTDTDDLLPYLETIDITRLL